MKPSPITARLFALQVASRPEDAQELAFLEDYMDWKAANGVKAYEAHRAKERHLHSLANYRLRVQQTKKI